MGAIQGLAIAAAHSIYRYSPAAAQSLAFVHVVPAIKKMYHAD